MSEFTTIKSSVPWTLPSVTFLMTPRPHVDFVDLHSDWKILPGAVIKFDWSPALLIGQRSFSTAMSDINSFICQRLEIYRAGSCIGDFFLRIERAATVRASVVLEQTPIGKATCSRLVLLVNSSSCCWITKIKVAAIGWISLIVLWLFVGAFSSLNASINTQGAWQIRHEHVTVR